MIVDAALSVFSGVRKIANQESPDYWLEQKMNFVYGDEQVVDEWPGLVARLAPYGEIGGSDVLNHVRCYVPRSTTRASTVFTLWPDDSTISGLMSNSAKRPSR